MESAGIQKQRKSTIKACLRCHRRKQRCVGFPACTNCRAANIPCSRDSTPLMRRLAGLSKEDLINKIEGLERKLSARGNNIQPSPSQSGGRRLSAVSTCSAFSARGDGNDETGFDSLGLDEQVIENDQPSPESAHNVYGRSIRNGEANGHQLVEPAENHEDGPGIDEDTGKELLATYLESMHRRVPFCDYAQLLLTLRVHTQPSKMALFRLYMACAIGAAIRQLTGTSASLHADKYFKKASQIRESMDKAKIAEETEVLLWNILYKLRSSFSSDVWYTIGLAIRTAVEAGLHRKHSYVNFDTAEANTRRCLFWAVYVIERNICWAMKRPFSLADQDIDTDLPSPMIHQTEPDGYGDHQRPVDYNVFIATIRLSRLNSEAYSLIYHVNQPFCREKIPLLLDKIRQFESSLPDFSAQDDDFLRLHTKNAIRIVVEPLLSSFEPSDPLIMTCLEACGSVCQLFKRLRLNRSLGYSFTMLNSVFISGLTICYIIFKHPKLWSPARSNHLRACSSTLFAAAERNSAVRKYCDVLETIIDGVMDHVEQITSSASILSGEGFDSPAVSGDSSSPREAFEKLGHTLRESNFEFPSQSYPIYRIKPDDACNDSTSNSQIPGMSFEGLLEQTQWNVLDFLESFNEDVTLTSQFLGAS